MKIKTKKRIKMVVHGAGLGFVCCTVIYGSLLWTGFRHLVELKPKPKRSL